jgi:hypothetical protein
MEFDYGIIDTHSKYYYSDGRFHSYGVMCQIYTHEDAIIIYSALSGIPKTEIVPLTIKSYDELIKLEGDKNEQIQA